MGGHKKSHKLEGVLYDIRGPALKEAHRLEEEGYHITKLNTGNPAAFGLEAPDEILHDVIVNLNNAQAYSESKGIFAARKAVMQYYQAQRVPNVDTEDIYIGNGVSELIVMAMQALLNTGYEVLIPSPDYPLWTAAVNLSGGKAVHYVCDEASDWIPDIRDIKRKITPKTKAIVVISPNNPTGAVYPREVLEKIVDLARRHDLIVFSDEIYDKILYDGAEHVFMGTVADDVPCVTLGGLSKGYRAAGFRAGWMVFSGDKNAIRDYIEGIDMLSNMRLCSNVPAQYAVQTALGGYQSINDLVAPGGRLREQRDCAYKEIVRIPGITCVKPSGALYLFPKVDTKKFRITSDARLILDLLVEAHVLLVQGTGFNWPAPDHFRLVFLPPLAELKAVMEKIREFFGSYRQSASR
ncbi:MAG: aminotransferase class I/II-fold pyridoxal phosphate-dependent enzyme [Chitinivibrionales bacterium]|nr:aminotransferase class I/II-fold pyridoxal phosphate-dependent enzyme [Chitinivibrionales bacterium]MBD3395085.1 aminotransferase class I/II-fold pyridoxal phosphate-dependent enzyme [Chitinivibrionales bacterium]